MVPKYRSSNVYTRNYLSHRTVQYSTQSVHSRSPVRTAHSFTDSSKSGSASRVAHSLGSGKFTRLSNKCFKCIQHICGETDVRPSQDHQILRICNRQINLAFWCGHDICLGVCIGAEWLLLEVLLELLSDTLIQC